MAAASPAGGAARRPYRSAVRQQRADQTRRRITEAAMELFTERGFAGTTVALIAERAGVAVPTVYAAFGSKGAIVRALLSQMETDAGGPDWARRIAAQTDPHAKLAAFARWTTRMLSSSRSAIQLARCASGDPALLALRDEGDRHRRDALRQVVAALSRAKALRPGLSQRRAVDRAWMLTGVEMYLAATEGCGWSDDAYAQWLADILQQQLLRDRPVS